MTIVSDSIVLDFTTKGKDMRKYFSTDKLVQKLSVEFNGAVNDYVALRIPEQAYFWTKEWQDGEKEADEDIKRGRIERFINIDALIGNLDS